MIAATLLIIFRHGFVITINQDITYPQPELVQVPEVEEEEEAPVNNFNEVIRATHELFGGIEDDRD